MEKKVMTSLEDEKVLVVGRGSGIARAIADAARRTGATVVTAGRHPEELAEAYDGDPQVSAEPVVSTASARARGLLADLERDAVRRSFDTKVIGPLMLARAFRDQINDGGSLVIFSGVAAFDIEPGTLAVAIINGAADTLTRSLAVELRRSASTRSPPASSTPAPGTRSATTARRSCSLRSASATRRAGSARPRTSLTQRSSR
jgi:NAD(P)-dependent dehydrogenase (short-subunit alcohol dehydrogenase family)